jgi:hypothetical protein
MDLLATMPLCSWRAAIVPRRLVLAFVLSFSAAPGLLRAQAQPAAPAEYQVKAAFLLNFAKFVEWPDAVSHRASMPFIVCILGEDPFGTDLTSIVAGQSVRGQSIRVRFYRYGDDLSACQVLFVSASEQSRLEHLLVSLRGTSMLTVSDMEGFAEAGGVMQFVIEDSRVRFVINLAAAERARLQISAKLLALARVVNRAEAR